MPGPGVVEYGAPNFSGTTQTYKPGQASKLHKRIVVLKASIEQEQKDLDFHLTVTNKSPWWHARERDYKESLGQKREMLPRLEDGLREMARHVQVDDRFGDIYLQKYCSLDDLIELENKVAVLRVSIENEQTQLESFHRFTRGMFRLSGEDWQRMEQLHTQSLAAKKRLLPQLVEDQHQLAVQLDIKAIEHIDHQFPRSGDRLSSDPSLTQSQHQKNNTNVNAQEPPANPEVGLPPMLLEAMSDMITHAGKPVAVLRLIFRGNERIVRYIEDNRAELLRRQTERGNTQLASRAQQQPHRTQQWVMAQARDMQAGPEPRAPFAASSSTNMPPPPINSHQDQGQRRRECHNKIVVLNASIAHEDQQLKQHLAQHRNRDARPPPPPWNDEVETRHLGSLADKKRMLAVMEDRLSALTGLRVPGPGLGTEQHGARKRKRVPEVEAVHA